MDWIFNIGIVLLVLGALSFIGIKLLPVKKNVNILFVIAGILMVTGLGASLFAGLTSLAVVPVHPNTPSNNAYTYSVLGVVDASTDLLDDNARVITIPETYNATKISASEATVTANFTIGITDAYADMRGVNVECSTPTFYQQNTSASDSTQYLIVSKDSAGLADIRIKDTTGAYQARTRTFLLGGQSTTGQSVTVIVSATVDPTALGKLNQYNSQDITCNVAGQQWALRIQKTSIVS